MSGIGTQETVDWTRFVIGFLSDSRNARAEIAVPHALAISGHLLKWFHGARRISPAIAHWVVTTDLSIVVPGSCSGGACGQSRGKLELLWDRPAPASGAGDDPATRCAPGRLSDLSASISHLQQCRAIAADGEG
jgi:hypothetical protein